MMEKKILLYSIALIVLLAAVSLVIFMGESEEEYPPLPTAPIGEAVSFMKDYSVEEYSSYSFDIVEVSSSGDVEGDVDVFSDDVFAVYSEVIVDGEFSGTFADNEYNEEGDFVLLKSGLPLHFDMSLPSGEQEVILAGFMYDKSTRSWNPDTIYVFSSTFEVGGSKEECSASKSCDGDVIVTTYADCSTREVDCASSNKICDGGACTDKPLKPLCAKCTRDSDCESGVCQQSEINTYADKRCTDGIRCFYPQSSGCLKGEGYYIPNSRGGRVCTDIDGVLQWVQVDY